MRPPKPVSAQQAVVVLLVLLAIYTIAGCSTFRGEGGDQLAFKGVIGQRNVAGIELPLIPGKLGVGVGGWFYRLQPEESVILEREQFILEGANDRK